MTHWARLAERGCSVGLRLLELCLRAFGIRAARLALYPVVLYFLLVNANARRASRQYFDQLHACKASAHATHLPPPGWATSFRHMFAFAESGLDKLAAWLGEIAPADVEFPARAHFEELLAQRRGALLIGAHLGNLEMLRALAVGGRVAPINAIVHTRHARRFRSLLARAHGDFALNLLEVTEMGADTAMLLSEKVGRGELVVMVGDRIPPSEGRRTCDAQFLGASAAFPQGPFVLGAALGCPVYLFLCVKEGARHRIHLELFAERIELPRARRAALLTSYVERYARRLEDYCYRYPYQWFNFFDFWSRPTAPAAAATGSVPPHPQPSAPPCKP
jgi:predicted LPLAT superfamily acyltransferase